MARKSGALPAWDLSDLYKSIKDPRIEADLKSAALKARRFAGRYRSKLHVLCKQPTGLAKALREYEQIQMEASKPIHYAYLVYSETGTDPARGAFLQRIRARHNAIQSEMLFFDLELLDLGRTRLRKFAAHKSLAPYRHYIHRLIQSEPHRLEENEERIMKDKALTGRAAFLRLFTQELSSQKYELKIGGKTRRLPESEVLSLLYNPSRATRKAAAKAFSRGLKKQSDRIGFIFNILAEDKAIDDRYRRFKTPEASRHLANEITQQMVDVMSGVVVSNYDLVRRYYRFKRKVLGLKTLYDYDRYAPVLKNGTRIPYSRARTMILEAFGRFSPEFAEITEKFFANNWIDAARRKGKRGGAYCSFVTPDVHPYVFLNYNGSVRDLFTLAHELGHAVHAWYMREQSYLNFDVPLTIAETASVFAEMLLFDYLRDNITDQRELFSLYIHKIDNIIATIFRQVSMYRFEQAYHNERLKRGELPVLEINRLWRASQREMFGSSVTLSDDYDWWWGYIPHFVHTPFYVYAYAFGELLTISLYRRYKRSGDTFVKKYISMLKAGGSKAPEALVKPLGVDLKRRAFWSGGMKVIGEMIQEAQRLKP